MSCTDTSLVPSTSEGLGTRSDVMPSASAIGTTFSGPTSSMSWAYTVLTEFAVPTVRSVTP
jgi:hypothetical protein